MWDASSIAANGRLQHVKLVIIRNLTEFWGEIRVFFYQTDNWLEIEMGVKMQKTRISNSEAVFSGLLVRNKI